MGIPGKQGWELAHSFIAHLLILLKSNERLWAIRSDRSRLISDREGIAQVAQRKCTTVSESLRPLRGNEQPWGNRSGQSEEISDCERIAQITQDKWATLSNSLRSLRGNERLSDSLKKIWLYTHFFFLWANRSFPLFWWAMWVNPSGCSPKMSDVSEIAQVANQKWATWADHIQKQDFRFF